MTARLNIQGRYVKKKYFWLLMVFFLAACATADPIQVLGFTIRSYERSFRWGDIEGTEKYRKERTEWDDKKRQSFENISITQYDVLDSVMDADEKALNQTVRIRYYHKDVLKEKTTIDRQRWEFDETAKRWYIVTPIPTFAR